jgi:oligoribonuclease NrnB/cAMP/cGMP phosphodiesterase (DHH superfamily)
MKDNRLVIYHGNCMDGFTAAWAVWLKHPDAEFVAGVYGEPPPDCTGRDVILVDFSYKRPVMEQIIAVAKSVLVLDHHKTAQADLAGLDTVFELHDKVNVIFDMDKSGARLAWEHFHPFMGLPLFVQMVEDRDLWKFSLPDCRALSAYFFSFEYDFMTWNGFLNDMEAVATRTRCIAAGEAIERKHHKDVAELVTKTRHVRYFVHGALGPIPCANLPYTLASDAANLMAEDAPFAATYYMDARGDYVFSLRSREDGADVSAVAAKYGGGGHAHAAGFRIKSLEEL